jgi:ribosomal protein S18 acetylase RimI-like enzyme
MRLRPFERADLPRLQAIRQAAFAPVFASFREIVGEQIAALAFATADEEQAKLLDNVSAPESGHEIWVAAEGDAIVGFVSLKVDAATRTGELGLNAVDPAHAGRGVGAAMYAHALARMKELGAVLATVGVGGDASHAPARRAYEKAGFGAGVPSLWMYKLL